VASECYLAKLQVKVTGKFATLAEYSQADRLYIARELLRQLEPLLLTRGKTFRGTKTFLPQPLNKKFRENILRKITINDGNQEKGRSQKNPANIDYTLDLSTKDWYAYNDNFGTSEEKALVKYIDGIMPKLEEKYDEIYLVRNEKDVHIFSFDEGRTFEPDYLLFLRQKGAGDKYDNLQIFIEPKGGQLLKTDKWKEDFLKEIHEMGEVRWMTAINDYQIWGLPFYNEEREASFNEAFMEVKEKSTSKNKNESFISQASEKSPASQAKEESPASQASEKTSSWQASDKTSSWQVQVLSSVPASSDRFTRFLPLYSVRAACGYFETSEAPEAEGWVDVSALPFTPNEDMFVVHAKGDSMLPRIKDGDLCVFERYRGGSREGEIVLSQASECFEEYGGKYTVKKYHSEKTLNEDGVEVHSKIELQPLNAKGFKNIEISEDAETQYATIGILKFIIGQE